MNCPILLKYEHDMFPIINATFKFHIVKGIYTRRNVSHFFLVHLKYPVDDFQQLSKLVIPKGFK